MNFGEYIKSLRQEMEIGLRQFCLKTGFDPSNWSKVERGVLDPPASKEVLRTIARVVRIEEGTEAWNTLCDLASISKGRIPNDIIHNQRLLSSLPMVFRTIRGEKPTRSELEAIVDIIRHS